MKWDFEDFKKLGDVGFTELQGATRGEKSLDYIISYFMSLSIITKHNLTGNSVYHLRLAIILIFKQAALLCLSGIPGKLALTQAESDFQKANIVSKIEECFTASYQEYTIEDFVSFLVKTNIAI